MIHRVPLGLLAAILPCGMAVSQQLTDPFNYPPGTTIPGYTEHVGDWQALGSQIQCQPGLSRQILTHDTIVDRDACVEVVAAYDTTAPGPQHAGPFIRFENPGGTPTFYYASLSDSQGTYLGWDRYSLRFEGSSMTILTGGLLGSYTRSRIRLQVSDHPSGNRIHIQVDLDMDGIWDVNDSRVTIYGLGSGAGGIGLFGGGGAIFDDLKYFGAPLYVDANPRIGTALPLRGRGTPGLLYVGACSLGHAGFPLGGGMVMPLDPDSLFVLSLANPVVFQNFQGTIDNAGDFTLTLNIPAIPLLVGATIWSSALTLTPQAIQEIAPDVQITFSP